MIHFRTFLPNFSVVESTPKGITLGVNWYSWDVNGGPDRAGVSASGRLTDLATLAGLLRHPVEISDDADERLWWGYVSDVSIRAGRFTFSASLSRMWNSVAVAYTEQVPGLGTQHGVTSYVDDAAAQLEYGVKELIAPQVNSSKSQAEQRRATLLNLYKWPVPALEFGGEGGSLSASIQCRGWWDTLGWKHYANEATVIVYIDEGVTGVAFGNVSGREKVAQSIVGNGNWSTGRIKFHVRLVGAPTDNLALNVCSDTAGAPGASLASASVAASTLSTVGGWAEFVLDSAVSITTGTTLWLVLSRSGAVDAANHYKVSCTPELGAPGVFRVYNGATWAADTPDVDAMHIVSGEGYVEAQIAAHIASAGQFLTGCDYAFATGVSAPSYRDKENNARTSVEALMRVGESSGDARLTATVGQDRRVTLGLLPVRGDADWTIDAKGVLRDSYRAIVANYKCPVGMWVQPVNTFLGEIPGARLADFSSFLVEHATYSAYADRWMPQFIGPLRDVQPIVFAGEGAGSWDTVRQLVLQRDGYRCVICGATAQESGGPLEVHHIIPRSMGGGNDLYNLVSLCHYHHTLTSTYGENPEDDW